MKIQLFYHINGRVCAVVKEENATVLTSRGWRPVPFSGVKYPNVKLLSNWNMPWYGKWALELPKCPMYVEKPKSAPVVEKKEPVEDRSELVPETPKKKRGRPRKED